MTRGEYISKLRKDRNMTQDEVASRLNIDRSTLSKYERGIVEMNLDVMKALSEIYNEKLINIIYADENAYKEIENNIETLHFEKHNSEINNLKLKRIILRNRLLSILVAFIIIILFFFYYFVNTYNSIKVYRIEPEEKDKVEFKNTDLIITNDSIYLNIIGISSKKKILKIELYYNEQLIISKNDIDYITIKDSIYDQKYFDFNNIKEIINNMYLKIYSTKNEITTKLIFHKIYNNSKLLFSKKTNNDVVIETDNNKIIVNNVEYYAYNIENDIIQFLNNNHEDMWTFSLNENIVNYSNKYIGSFQYNLDTKKYTSGKHNDEKLKLFFEIYKMYKENYER